MRVFSISHEVASLLWNQRKNGEEILFTDSDAEVIGPDGSDLLSDLELEDLVDRLDDLKGNYNGKQRSASVAGKVDAEACEIVHSELSTKLDISELSQIGFWRWLSIVARSGYFWDFIDWRIGGDQQLNWGVVGPGSIVEVYFYRAWLRGHKMIEPGSSDPYKYAKIGASDVWRSHLLRVEFGRDREFVKAFLDTVYDEQGKTLIGTKELRTELIPAIRAWTSGGMFAHLSYKENLELLKMIKEQGV